MEIAINNIFIPDFKELVFRKCSIGISKGKIVSISENKIKGNITIDGEGCYLTPGLIDCHCHIESSYLLPSQFGNEALKRGVLHVVADCHEIANVVCYIWWKNHY